MSLNVSDVLPSRVFWKLAATVMAGAFVYTVGSLGSLVSSQLNGLRTDVGALTGTVAGLTVALDGQTKSLVETRAIFQRFADRLERDENKLADLAMKEGKAEAKLDDAMQNFEWVRKGAAKGNGAYRGDESPGP